MYDVRSKNRKRLHMLTIKRLHHRIFTFLLTLLLLSGVVNEAWATNVTYHILTLPIDNNIYHMKDEISGKRLEAFKVTITGQSQLELPAQYKSPLAKDFTYYAADDVTKSASVVNLFANNNNTKGFTYELKGGATPVAEGTTLSVSETEYYVVYTYNTSNTIAKLDGSVKYNIKTIGYNNNNKEVEKGFFALNRGRNNRPAVLPKTLVNSENLSSEDFMKFEYDTKDKNRFVNGTKVSAFWVDNNNKNKEADVAGQFYFMFKLEGLDPYNIIIRTAYAKDTTYIEKNDGTNDFVYKWYKDGSLFASRKDDNNSNNAYIASDDHRRYNYIYDSSLPANPTDLTEDSGTGWDVRNGFYHGQGGAIWNSFTLLNNGNTGFVFMGTRTVDGSGNTPASPFYLKEANTCNNLVLNKCSASDAKNNLTIERLYPIKKVTYKIATSFYAVTPSTDHIVSVEGQVSQYTVENDDIKTRYLPNALKRKYIEFNGKFYKDAACTQEITKFSEADEDPTEGYQVYVGYDVSPSPKFLSPSASYTTATWYELTDEGSTQEYGRKIKYDISSSTYKNNGANGEYAKESEFALVGDPYELKVLYRKGTEDAGSNSYVTLSTHDSWDMPYDATAGSFLLREYKGTGHWNWNSGEPTGAVTYQSNLAFSADKDAQTITFNLSGLNGGKYYKITTGGTDASQIVSVNPRAGFVYKETATIATIAVSLAANTSGSDKVMTVTIQEYNDDKGTSATGTPSVITITQGTTSSSFAGNTVDYSTTNSTRVKVLDLPKYSFTYNIVDKSGRIAVKATSEQTIFSKLSLASIPSIIISPFVVDETLTFYDTYTDGAGRSSLSGAITETPNAAANIYVKYTTTHINDKPINLSEDQQFNVVLNGEYIYYDSSDGGSIKSKTTPTPAELQDKNFLWKLRNRDPYAMLIDNMGAREVLPDVEHKVAGQTESVTRYNDDGSYTTESRQKGAWVKLAAALGNDVALTFDTDRATAQRFIAKASVNTGVYEVMVAAGADVDASTTYYNIGRPTENSVKIYYNNSGSGGYVHGNDVLKFRLEQTTPYTYHLIDKANHELLTLTSQSPDLALPADYQSPLVETYHYYAENDINKAGDVYTVKADPNPLRTLADLNATYTKTASTSDAWAAAAEGYKLEASDDTDLDTKAKKLTDTEHDYYFKVNNGTSYCLVHITRAYRGTHIYVTYDANDIVKFGNTYQYSLKFLEPFAEGYLLEDGNDKLTSTKLQAVYPYTNGDGNLNIYSQAMKDEQMGGGASTRPRWVWYFNSTNNDPYHVRIHSRNTISYNGTGHPTYLQTYAVHFNQDTEKPKQQRIVTGGTLPGISSITPTEYMILGAQGAYKLMTTYAIPADLDGDGNTTGTGENERYKVTSLEQYWKTYNMAKLHVLGVSASTDAYSTDESTWVVPKTDDPATGDVDESIYRTTLTGRGWHSYTAYANATRWNGYNDKEDGHEKKVVENIEHWYQTFNMGNGTFDIESADIPPVLVLLDLHGWEIMRLPLPTTNYPEGETELAALRAYDSPMVDKYYFYSNATKASGCHKYSLRMQNGAERDQIKVNGEHYTSTSLGNLPPAKATGVKSSGAFNDQFVIYTVKEEYAKSYSYDYSTETETASEFLMVQHGRFYKYENKGTIGSSYMTKPIIEHTNPEGGNVYDMVLDPKNKSGNDNIVTGEDNHWIGNCLWYVKPNQNIDKEMGIKYASVAGGTGEPWTEAETKKYYHDIGKDGFDPYNLQIQLKNKNDGTADGRYLSSHQTSTRLENGVLIGDYDEGSGGTTNITLTAGYNYTEWDPLTPTTSTGYDHTNLTISNQTFMAVSDANGNMQLMPRFDHKKRVDLDGNSPWNTTLEDPVDHPKASAEDNASQGNQTTFFVRPQRLIYEIIDNEGRESLRYKRGGDYFPTITDHFRSPLAKNFTYYKGLAEPGDAVESTADEWTAATGDFKRTATTEALMNSQKNLLPTAGTYYYRISKPSIAYMKVTVAEGKGLLDKQITGSFAEAGINSNDYEVKVRYEYDADADHDGDRILEGKWFTVKLANKDLMSSETRIVTTEGETQGTNVSLFQGESKPATIDASVPLWQWKFLAAPADPSSEYYVAPDPYDVQIFNRYANYTTTLAEPSPMSVGIKVPNANNGADHFALLSHTSEGYALAVAGLGTYTYNFLNGADMSTSVAATTAEETSFTQKAGIFDGVKSQLVLNNDVTHNFVYNVVNNANKFAVSATQDEGAAEAHSFQPYLPEDAQTPLLRMKDYKYYGSATVSSGTYTVVPNTKLFTLHGLYDDAVYVRYEAYHVDSTEFKIPNKKAVVAGKVARDPSSVDVSMNIEGGLPYNIIWENDNMMKSMDDATITYGESQSLSGNQEFVWYFTGNDPYNLKIEHKKTGNYVYSSDGSTCVLHETNSTPFMLLRKSGYDYGILQVVGETKKLSGYGNSLTADDPGKFIVFGLSVHDLIYRLIIAKTCANTGSPGAGESVVIPYMTAVSGTPGSKTIYGTTQRDLTSQVSGVAGDKYQLGETISVNDGSTTTPYVYCVDAGAVSIGDLLEVPNEFNRPNCTYEFYIDGVWDSYNSSTKTISNANGTLNGKYKGIKLNEVSPRLMSDADLIDKVVRVNIVYSFDKSLATNSGLDFVRSTDQNLWYTMETQEAAVPQLARYTKTQGLTAIAGRETHYTNDYLFTPVGDVYGFKMYNRYTVKNSNEDDDDDQSMVMTSTALTGTTPITIAVPGSSTTDPEPETYTLGNEIYELITGDTPGYFRVHPVANNSGDVVYLKKDGSALKLSTTPQDWTFGLDMAMLQPYYLGAGNVGGLNATGKAAYKAEIDKGEGSYKITDIQAIVYNDANIVHFTPGYYRLHSQPGIAGISPVRYASGYLHEIEKTAGDESTAIPLHFYSKQGVSTTFAGEGGLGSGFTGTPATRGEIPIAPTENDPSTIFYVTGSNLTNNTLSNVAMGTQDLNVIGNKMGTGAATTYRLVDIGGGVVLLLSGDNYLTFDQNETNKYDLHYKSSFRIDDVKWCMEPANTLGLKVATNNGGDGYYYSTLYMPFDVLLPADAASKTYNAYICKKWHNEGVNPVPVPEKKIAETTYGEGKFVPAGTPVIIRTNDDSEEMKLTLPSATPSSSLSCVFTGEYLEKKLDASSPARDVYTLGLPMTSEVTKNVDYVTSGGITAPLPTFANNGVGFYINATSNKEADPLQSLWTRNNLYVLHNKIYYRATGSSSRELSMRGIEFVPIIFDNDEEGGELPGEEEQNPSEGATFQGDGCIYDMMGRKVATRQQVEDGSWRLLRPGIYILNGKKFRH